MGPGVPGKARLEGAASNQNGKLGDIQELMSYVCDLRMEDRRPQFADRNAGPWKTALKAAYDRNNGNRMRTVRFEQGGRIDWKKSGPYDQRDHRNLVCKRTGATRAVHSAAPANSVMVDGWKEQGAKLQWQSQGVTVSVDMHDLFSNPQAMVPP